MTKEDKYNSIIRDIVKQVPVFASLTEEQLNGMAECGNYFNCDPGEVLVSENENQASLLIGVHGEWQFESNGRLIRFEEDFILLNLLEIVNKSTGLFTISSVAGGDYLSIPLGMVDDYLNSTEALSPINQYLQKELSRLHGKINKFVESCDDFYESPNAQIIPGPYLFGPFTAYVCLVNTERQSLKKLLPKGLSLLPYLDNCYLLVISDLENCSTVNKMGDGRRFSYREVTPMIFCRRGFLKVGVFIPELYPDAYMPILLGREIYGFPKRMGRIAMDENGVDLIVDNQRRLKARWRNPESLSFHQFLLLFATVLFSKIPAYPRLKDKVSKILQNMMETHALLPLKASVFVRKKIASVSPGEKRRWEIDKLVEVPFEFFRLENIKRLRCHDFSFSSDQDILTGEVEEVFRVTTEFKFDNGRYV